MMAMRFAACLVVWLAVTGSVCSAEAVTAAADKVSRVSVTGLKAVPRDAVQKVISLRAGDDYSDQASAKDQKAILGLGWFSKVNVQKSRDSGGIAVSYQVIENPRVARVDVTGSEPVAASQVRELMKTRVGEILNTATLSKDIDAIQQYYQSQGYFAYVTERIGLDPKTRVLAVPVLVHKVESVTFEGLIAQKPEELAQKMATKPGVVFNIKTLKQDIMAIYNLGFFEDIKPYKIAPGSSKGLVTVTIPVVEK